MTNIKHVLSGTNGGSKRANKDNTVYLGNFLVDVNSINIVLESYQIDNLPKRPRLILNGEESTVVVCLFPFILNRKHCYLSW